jgi:hypothetical protein
LPGCSRPAQVLRECCAERSNESQPRAFAFVFAFGFDFISVNQCSSVVPTAFAFHFQISPHIIPRMNSNPNSSLPSTVLFILGCVDLLRGTLHTFLVHWSALTFAHLDLSQSGQDQLVLLGAFGISNLLTGMIYILISRKAKPLAEYVLMLIVTAYALGYIGVKLAGVKAHAEFLGKHFLLVYMGVCVATVIIARMRRGNAQP